MNSTIQPLNDKIIFQFVDTVTNGKFVEQRSTGIVADIGNDFMRYAGLCRCAKVVATGPDVSDVDVGDEIVIENLKWTKSFDINQEKFWMTTRPHVLGKVSRT